MEIKQVFTFAGFMNKKDLNPIMYINKKEKKEHERT